MLFPNLRRNINDFPAFELRNRDDNLTEKPGTMCWSFQALLWATKPNLHTQHIPHCFGGFFLGGGGDMGVGVQGEACGEVTEHTADRLDVNAIL